MRSLIHSNGNIFDLMDDFLKNVNHEVLKVDIIENDTSYVVYADAPEVPRENIKVNFNRGILTIDIKERQQKERKEGERVLHSERSYTHRSRSFNFGESIDENAINAEHKEGVLVLTLPKKEQVNTFREIEIK